MNLNDRLHQIHDLIASTKEEVLTKVVTEMGRTDDELVIDTDRIRFLISPQDHLRQFLEVDGIIVGQFNGGWEGRRFTYYFTPTGLKT